MGLETPQRCERFKTANGNGIETKLKMASPINDYFKTEINQVYVSLMEAITPKMRTRCFGEENADIITRPKALHNKKEPAPQVNYGEDNFAHSLQLREKFNRKFKLTKFHTHTRSKQSTQYSDIIVLWLSRQERG